MNLEKKKVIVVDDNLTNRTVCKNILKTYYEVYSASNAARMFELMERFLPDMILLDVEMPEMNGYEAARILKNNGDYRDVPFIFLSGRRDEKSEMEGLNLGAADYIFMPFSAALLIRRIETHLSIMEHKKEIEGLNKSTQKMLIQKMGQVWKLQNAVFGIVAELVEFRDEVTGGHIDRTQGYLSCLIEAMTDKGVYAKETDDWDLDFVIPSAQLHDLGKIGISDVILNKPGRLTAEEYEIIKTHVKIGVDAITRMERITDDHGFFRHAKLFAGTHHERWDGKGYPEGLAGTDIPLEGRLMAVVDVYDALISVRPYKEAYNREYVDKLIRDGSGTQFDPRLVDIYRGVSDEFAEIAGRVAE